MTQDEKEKSDGVKTSKAGGDKRPRQQKGRIMKVVIRRLPPLITEEDLLEQLSPLPEHDAFYFVPAEHSMSGLSFSRAYFAFRHPEEVVSFRDRWDGYVFLDDRGQEYMAIVEFAPFQKMPRKKPKKPDNKSGSIEQDAEYLKFVETMDVEEEVDLPSLEATVEELERRDRELRANNGVPNVVTPLIEFVLAKKMEKFRVREERREERKRKDAERKRAKDEKRRNKRDQTARTARDNTIREESEEEVVSVEDDSYRLMEFRHRGEEGGARHNRDRIGGEDRGAEGQKSLHRERNRRGNKENRKNPGKGGQGHGNPDSNNNRGANDDEDMVGSSPVPRRHPGPRDRAERDRDRRGNDERHAKYYDEPREPKSSNQRRNRGHDADGEQYTEDGRAPRREKKNRDRQREKARNANEAGNNGRRNRGNDREDRRDQREDPVGVDRVEVKKPAEERPNADEQREEKKTRTTGGRTESASSLAVDRGEGHGSEDRRDRPERVDRRDGNPQRKQNNPKADRRDSNQRKREGPEREEHREEGRGGAKARGPKTPAGDRPKGGGDRRDDRGAAPAAKKDSSKPGSKRYSDTRPTPLGKPKNGEGSEAGTSNNDSSYRGKSANYDNAQGDVREAESCRNMEPNDAKSGPRQKEDVKKVRNKFRPAIEIYKPTSARKKNEGDRDANSASPEFQQ